MKTITCIHGGRTTYHKYETRTRNTRTIQNSKTLLVQDNSRKNSTDTRGTGQEDNYLAQERRKNN